MRLDKAVGELKRVRNNPWRFQKTYLTPLRDLKNFVAVVLSTLEINEGSLIIDTVVFSPDHLFRLLAQHSIHSEDLRNAKISASEHNELAALLEVAFGEVLDFLFVPSPKKFAIYADHDEYTTFFTNSHSNLNKLEEAFKNRGYKPIPDYSRFA